MENSTSREKPLSWEEVELRFVLSWLVKSLTFELLDLLLRSLLPCSWKNFLSSLTKTPIVSHWFISAFGLIDDSILYLWCKCKSCKLEVTRNPIKNAVFNKFFCPPLINFGIQAASSDDSSTQQQTRRELGARPEEFKSGRKNWKKSAEWIFLLIFPFKIFNIL